MVNGRGSEVLGVGVGGVERTEQGQCLATEGVFDEGKLVEILGAQDRLNPRGFGVDAAVAAGVAQERSELGNSQLRGRARGGDGGQESTCLGTEQTAAFVGEGF
jgi:hypothetical protein